MRLIGINGFKTSGKDTTYLHIKSLNAGKAVVERRAFADNLKIMAARALGYTDEPSTLIQIMDYYKNDATITVTFNGSSAQQELSGRQYLQNFGNRAREVFGDSFWVDQVVPTDLKRFIAIWEAGIALPDIGCVTDVRYPNEAERIRACGGEVWEVVRPGLESDGHESETPLAAGLTDRTVINAGTIDDLRDAVKEALNAKAK